MDAKDTTIVVAEPQEPAPWLTVERAGYAVAGLLAAIMRFAGLGFRPLNEAEAVQALAALRFTDGSFQAPPTGTVPGLFTGNVLAFTLMGSGDAIVRWLPALAGLILVLLPYGLRRRLGRGGALAASFLLAVSPSAVFFSRSLDGAILAATCGLAMVVGLLNAIDTGRPGGWYVAAAALGLGLTVGSGIYTILLILLAFGLLLYLQYRLREDSPGWPALAVAWGMFRSDRGLLVRTGGLLAATFGLAAMTLVLHPSGVGHAADLVGDWARSFLPEPGGQPPIYPLLLLLHYELLVTVMGLVEIGRWLARNRLKREDPMEAGFSLPHTALLVFWALVATFVILISGHRPAGNVLLVVVPLALLAGQGMERAWRWIHGSHVWRQAALVTVAASGLCIYLYLQIVAYVQAGGGATVSFAGITLLANSTYLILAGVGLLLLIVLGVAAWIWRGPHLLLGAGWLVILLLLGLWGFRAMWGLSFANAGDASELMIVRSTSPDVRLFAERLGALSLEKADDATTLPITVDATTGPVVAWYMRDFQQQFVVEELYAQPGTLAAVSLAAQDLPIGETFRGQGFPLQKQWMPWGLGAKDVVRWLLFMEASLPAVEQEVVLWVMGQP